MIAAILAPLAISVIFIFIILFVMKNRFTLLKFYMTVVSLVAVIGLAIGYGVAIYSGIQSAVISDAEYMTGRGVRYQLDVCTQPKYVGGESQATEPTEEEIQSCEDEARTNMIAERSYTTKQNVIGGLVWGTIALILFLVHYPMLLKTKNDEE